MAKNDPLTTNQYMGNHSSTAMQPAENHSQIAVQPVHNNPLNATEYMEIVKSLGSIPVVHQVTNIVADAILAPPSPDNKKNLVRRKLQNVVYYFTLIVSFFFGAGMIKGLADYLPPQLLAIMTGVVIAIGLVSPKLSSRLLGRYYDAMLKRSKEFTDKQPELEKLLESYKDDPAQVAGLLIDVLRGKYEKESEGPNKETNPKASSSPSPEEKQEKTMGEAALNQARHADNATVEKNASLQKQNHTHRHSSHSPKTLERRRRQLERRRIREERREKGFKAAQETVIWMRELSERAQTMLGTVQINPDKGIAMAPAPSDAENLSPVAASQPIPLKMS